MSTIQNDIEAFQNAAELLLSNGYSREELKEMIDNFEFEVDEIKRLSGSIKGLATNYSYLGEE